MLSFIYLSCHDSISLGSRRNPRKGVIIRSETLNTDMGPLSYYASYSSVSLHHITMRSSPRRASKVCLLTTHRTPELLFPPYATPHGKRPLLVGLGGCTPTSDAKTCRVAGTGPKHSRSCFLSDHEQHKTGASGGEALICSALSPRRTSLNITGASPLSARAPHRSPTD